MNCICCGYPFESVKEGTGNEHEGPGRAITPAGHMHWRCYWDFRERSYEEAIDRLKRAGSLEACWMA